MFTNRQLAIFITEYQLYATMIGYLIGCYGFKNNRVIHPIIYVLLLTFLNYKLLENSDILTVTDFHFYNPIQLLLLGWFFHRNFENRALKSSVPYTLAVFMVFAIFNTIFLQGLNDYPSNFIIGETLLLIVWSTYLFIEKLDVPAHINVFKDPVFITSIAIICFNLFSFVFFLLLTYFQKHKIDQYSSITRLLYFANVIYYLLLIIANIFSLKKSSR